MVLEAVAQLIESGHENESKKCHNNASGDYAISKFSRVGVDCPDTNG
jgi:hypothetical protein